MIKKKTASGVFEHSSDGNQDQLSHEEKKWEFQWRNFKVQGLKMKASDKLWGIMMPKFGDISANHCGLRTPRSWNIDAPHVKISWRVSKLPRLMSKVEKAKMVVAVWFLLHPFALGCFGIHPTTSSTTYRAVINAAWYWGIIPSRHSFCCVFILGRWIDHLNLGVINFHFCHHLWSQHLRSSWKIQGTHTKHPIPAVPDPARLGRVRHINRASQPVEKSDGLPEWDTLVGMCSILPRKESHVWNICLSQIWSGWRRLDSLWEEVRTEDPNCFCCFSWLLISTSTNKNGSPHVFMKRWTNVDVSSCWNRFISGPKVVAANKMIIQNWTSWN